MHTLNKNELFSIAIHLGIGDLLNFCSTNKYIRNKVYLRNEIWDYKLRTEFPEDKKLFKTLNKREVFKKLFLDRHFYYDCWLDVYQEWVKEQKGEIK